MNDVRKMIDGTLKVTVGEKIKEKRVPKKLSEERLRELQGDVKPETIEKLREALAMHEAQIYAEDMDTETIYYMLYNGCVGWKEKPVEEVLQALQEELEYRSEEEQTDFFKTMEDFAQDFIKRNAT